MASVWVAGLLSLLFLWARPARPAQPAPIDAPGGAIVLDPGHGGANVGAPGRVIAGAQAYEKQVTLAVAQRVRGLLVAQGYRVVMTREDDRYLTLRERVRRANAARPLLFLSLHANASPDHSQRGIETFVLDRSVAEVEARRHAQQATGAVDALLRDVRASHWLAESARLGRLLQDSLVTLRGALDRGLRQADHDVLSGVQAPAVLVELGFIDHVVEGPLLLEPAIQDQLALAILQGIQRYLGKDAAGGGFGPWEPAP